MDGRLNHTPEENAQIAQWAEQMVSNGEPVDSYLEHVSQDREAVDRMEHALNHDGSYLPQQLAQELLHKTAGFAQGYVDELMSVQCQGLPEEVVHEIQAETSSQLDS